MKKIIIYTLLIFLLCVATSCNSNKSLINDRTISYYETAEDNNLLTNNDYSNNYTEEQNMSNNYKIRVNGNDILFEESLLINHEEQYAEIPLLATLRALNCQVEWINDKNVKIVHNNIEYILDTRKNTLQKKGDSFNYIAIAPGATHAVHCKTMNGEFIIDSDSIRYYISILGAKIIIDYDKNVVEIDWK